MAASCWLFGRSTVIEDNSNRYIITKLAFGFDVELSEEYYRNGN